MKLSIVSPTFNCVEQLRRHCESVRRQTFKDIEHILIDNMSTDGTCEAVEEHQRLSVFPVTHIREPDTGIYQAMNKGIRHARGEWVHILNSDNTYHSDRILEEVFERDLAAFDLIACGIILVKEGREIYIQPQYDSAVPEFQFPQQGTLIRKSFYEKHGLYSERFRTVSDSIFRHRNYPKAQWLIVDTPLAVCPGGGLSGTPSLSNTMENVIEHIFFHNYSFRLRLYRAAFQVRSYLKYLLQRTGDETG